MRSSHLTHTFDRFFGREPELERLDHLTRTHRLVTITGPPGGGKSRLAHTFAHRAAADATRPGHLVWVRLTPRSSTSELIAETFACLHPDAHIAASENALLEHLEHSDQTLLLILDDFDRLTPHAPLLVRWLQATPHLHLLVTSRTRLELPGEHILELPPLPSNDALDLFIDRVHAVQPDLDFDTPTHHQAAHHIVSRLDGFPLALEFVARRTLILDLPQLAERLAPRDGAEIPASRPARSALNAAIETSWSMLDPDLRNTLAGCAIFSGRFSAQDASQLLSSGEDTLDALHELRAASLLRTRTAPSGSRFFELYSVIRAFAWKHLDDARQNDLVQRHAELFAKRVEPLYRSRYTDHEGNTLAAIEAVEVELRAILDRAERYTDINPSCVLTVGLALAMLLEYRGHMTTSLLHYASLQPRVDEVDDDVLRADFLTAYSLALHTSVLPDREIDIAQTALEAAVRSSDPERIAMAHLRLFDTTYRAEPARAEVHALAALEIATTHDLEHGIAYAHAYLGLLASRQGDLEGSIEHFEISRQTYLRGDAFVGLAWVLTCLSENYQWQCRPHDALGVLENARSILDDQHHLVHLHVQWHLISVLTDLERHDEAAALASEILRAARDEEPDTVRSCLTFQAEIWHDQGLFERARQDYLQALKIPSEPDSLETWDSHYGLAQLPHSDALGHLQAALQDATRLHDSRRVHLALAALPRLFALAHQPSSSRDAEEQLRGAFEHPLTTLHHNILTLELAALPVLRPDHDASDTETHTLEDALAAVYRGGERSLFARSSWLRRTVRNITPHLSQPSRVRVQISALDEDALLVDPVASRFRVPGEEEEEERWVDLSSKALQMRILMAFIDARLEMPGHVLDQDTLVAAGWPDEKMSWESAYRRLHKALSGLRRVGFRALLETHDEGYRLDPRVPVVMLDGVLR